MATNETPRKNIFGKKAALEQAQLEQSQIPEPTSSDKGVLPEMSTNQDDVAMPQWDEPPMDAYYEDSGRPSSDDSFDNREYLVPDEFSSEEAPATTPVPEGKLEVYAYSRTVQKFNQSVLFNAGISMDIARKAQQAEVDRKKEFYRQQNQQNSAPTPSPAPARAPIAQAPQKPANNAPTPQNSNINSYQNQAKPEENNETPAPANNGGPKNVSNHIAYLEATPLLIIMEHFANGNFSGRKIVANHLYKNQFDMGGYKISIDVENNKWYNITTRRGNTNALSLARELIAIDEDINLDDRENFKIASSKSAKTVNDIQRNIEKYTDLKDLIELTRQSEQKQKQNNSSTPKKNEEKKEEPVNQKTPEEEKEAWRQMREYLDNIPLKEIAEWLGATPGEDGNSEMWKFHSTSHNISITGQRFKNWNYSGGKGGYGAINFMKQHFAITEMIPETEEKLLYSKAFNALMKEFGDKDFKFTLSTDSLSSAFCFPHILPGKTDEIKYYLKDKRNIPLWMINKQISNGVLFAGYPSDREPDKLLRDSEKMSNNNVWATFLAPNGMAAEMRGIGESNKPAKILARGSEKNTGGYIVLAEPKYDENILSICEASVDATSYSSLYPGRSSTSIMGVTVDLAVELAFEADSRDLKTHINFDNDFAGNSATYQFHKKMLEQVEDEASYNDYLDSGKIKYFELATQVFKESLKTGVPFYFDMNSTDDGMETSNLFLKALFREIPREEVKNHLIKGRLKVNNVCPAWVDIKDADFEAKKAIELLKKNSRYYYYPEPIKALEPIKKGTRLTSEQEAARAENHALNAQKREDFIKAFKENAGPENLALWALDKRIADNIEPLSKDWNDWMGYQLTHHKEIRVEFEQREEEFKGYANLVKKMSPKELGNNENIKKVKPN